MAEKTGPKQAKSGSSGFPPGTSGNPKGRPQGARNKTTMAVERLLEGEATALARKCIERAKEGDGLALKLVMERIAPLRRGRPVQFDMPPLDDAGSLVKALGGVLKAVGSGALTPDEGAVVSGILEAKRRAIETVEIEARLSKLERCAEKTQ